MATVRQAGAATALFIAAAAPLMLGGALAQEIDVDLELVLAVDVSRSMDPAEQDLQRQGYADALRHPRVIEAITAGFLGRIAVIYVEWAGPGSQVVVAPWTTIDNAGSAARFVESLSARPVSFLRGTSISGAIGFAAGLFDDNGYAGMRQVIDVSGDGPNNMGGPVVASRDAALALGIVINGLPIMLNQDYFGGYSIRELDVYYEDCVIGGPGAFLITLESADRFAEAIRRKLVLEIAGAPPQFLPAQFSDREPRIDCMIGEKLRRRWMDP